MWAGYVPGWVYQGGVPDGVHYLLPGTGVWLMTDSGLSLTGPDWPWLTLTWPGLGWPCAFPASKPVHVARPRYGPYVS